MEVAPEVSREDIGRTMPGSAARVAVEEGVAACVEAVVSGES